MSNGLTLRPSEIEDCAELALTLRAADRKELAMGGARSPYDALLRGYLQSDSPMSIVAPDGSVVAMWGAAPISPNLGSPWMLGADGLTKHRWQFLREGRAHMETLHETYPFLYNEVWEGNTLHINWLKWLGFTVSEAPVNRPHFLPFWRTKNV